ncbi:MAG: hypothetical protein V4709_12865 [Pseudomonadota bacterium]
MRLAALCLLLPLHAVGAPPVTLVDVAMGRDDNIQAARDGLPRDTETWLQAGISSSFSEVLDDSLSLRLVGRLDGRLHAETEGLNEITAGVDGQLLLRPGRSFHTPVLGVSLGIGASEFQSDLRDAKEARTRLWLVQALTTRLAARGSLFASWRGSDSRVFDANTQGGELALDWQADTPLALSLGYQYREGRVVSIGMPNAALRANAVAIEDDDAFAGLMVFSFPAQTHIGFVTASYVLTPQLSLDATLRYIESDSRFGSSYHRWLGLTGLVLRF